MIRRFLPGSTRAIAKAAAEKSLPIFETLTGFHTARGDYLPNRLRILLGTYEREELRLMTPFVRRAKTIFDVGANVGYVTRFFARTAPRARVFSFEPNSIIFPILSRNVARFDNVRASNFGLSHVEAKMPLFLAGDDHSVASLTHEYPATHADHHDHFNLNAVTAKLVRGDDFAQRESIGTIDALKIDVEGWELNVLAGLEATIARSPSITIFCEFNAQAQRCAGREPAELPAWFLDHAFTLSANAGGVLRELPREPSAVLAELPTQTAYPTLFATRH